MLKYNQDCAILIMSCDKNEALLNIFFDFFKKNWQDCHFDIFLGVEKKEMCFENVTTLNSNENSFCSRLKEFLKIIGREYVLIILDDFLLEYKVDNCEIEKYLDVIKNNTRIVNITLAWIDGIETHYNDTLMKKAWNSNYLVNLQVGFWRVEFLDRILFEGENAWEAELLGSIRARKYRNELFLHLYSDDIMPYKYNRGWLIVKGCWNANEIKRLGLESYAIYFLDGKNILYDNFGKSSKMNSAKIRFRVFIRKAMSNIGVYF